MGNSIKTPEIPPTNTENSLLHIVPPYNEILDPSERIKLDEMIASQKKWQEEKDKKDEMYKNVALTKEFLQQNITKESWMEFQPPITKLLTKDIYGFDILNIDLMEYGLKYSKYISSVKIQFFSKDFDDETINTFLRNTCYNLTFDTYNLIFYGNFVQNQNILLSNNLENYIVLPSYIAKAYNYIHINIINIQKLFPILEKLEVKILVSTVEFNEFAEGRINYESCFEQNYDRIDGTWNRLNIVNSGHACVGYALNQPK